jgi:hypothetical protein
MEHALKGAVALLLAVSMPLGWTATFPDVTYQHGYPGFPESTSRGTLSTESEGIHFTSSSGRTWVIPYPALEEHRWQEKTETSGGGPGLGFLAGPNPILMAASLGFTALSYGLRKATSDKHTYLYILRFKDQNGVSQEVSLTLPNEWTQQQFRDDVNQKLTAYQNRMRDDYMRVMNEQHQQQFAGVEDSTEIEDINDFAATMGNPPNPQTSYSPEE